MNIAIVGGGKLCRKLLDLTEAYTFRELTPKIVAVADIKDDAPGLLRAEEKGIFYHKRL